MWRRLEQQNEFAVIKCKDLSIKGIKPLSLELPGLSVGLVAEVPGVEGDAKSSRPLLIHVAAEKRLSPASCWNAPAPASTTSLDRAAFQHCLIYVA